MPMSLRGEETGIEFDVFNDRAAVQEYATEGVDPSLDRSANFRWSGDEHEMLAGLCAAAALAKITNGVVYDEAEGRLLSTAEAIAVARRNLESMRRDRVKRPGTRPADIKRYLKPLVKLRTDLALYGRLLIIRPVRHILRGAFLDRLSDKHQFRVFYYLRPLYERTGLGYGGYIQPSRVWEPHFEHELMDLLANDIFAHVGRLATLGDVGDELAGTQRFHTARVTAFILAGEREQAAAYIEDASKEGADNPYWRRWPSEQRAFLARDTDSICAEYHSKEAETAKELKLGDGYLRHSRRNCPQPSARPNQANPCFP